jgi:PEGA domain
MIYPALVFVRRATTIAACTAAALLTGCATIIKGTHQEIPVSTDPSNASVLVDGVRQGYTPTKLNLARKASYVVTLELEGHESESVTLKPSIGGAVAGNIIAGGLIGWGVDAGTGAQYNLHPDTISVRLRPRATPAAPPKSSIEDMLRELARLDSLKAEGKVSDEEYSTLRSGILKRYQ